MFGKKRKSKEERRLSGISVGLVVACSMEDFDTARDLAGELHEAEQLKVYVVSACMVIGEYLVANTGLVPGNAQLNFFDRESGDRMDPQALQAEGNEETTAIVYAGRLLTMFVNDEQPTFDAVWFTATDRTKIEIAVKLTAMAAQPEGWLKI